MRYVESCRGDEYMHLSSGVGEVEWLYTSKFDVPGTEQEWKHAELVLEGLDTICDVYLVSDHAIEPHRMYGLTQSQERSQNPVRRQYVPYLGRECSATEDLHG